MSVQFRGGLSGILHQAVPSGSDWSPKGLKKVPILRADLSDLYDQLLPAPSGSLIAKVARRTGIAARSPPDVKEAAK
jgi:hypothetical protein